MSWEWNCTASAGSQLHIDHIILSTRIFRKQAASAPSLRDRMAWRLASVGMKQYQLKLMAAAAGVFDISLDDIAVWESLGVQDIRWLPPLPQLAIAKPSVERVPIDVVFVGGFLADPE